MYIFGGCAGCILYAPSGPLFIPFYPTFCLELVYRYYGSAYSGLLFSSRFHAKSEIKVFMSPVPSLQGSTDCILQPKVYLAPTAV